MTIDKVMDHVRKLKEGCEISDEALIEFINRVENQAVAEVMEGREGEPEQTPEYDLETNRSTVLLIGAPYDSIYESYCAAQIDLRLEDIERYQNGMAVFNSVFREFKHDWIKKHRQKSSYRYFAR